MKLLCDGINNFSGDANEEIEPWIDRLKIIAGALNSTEEDVVRQLPVMLSGSAYQVWTSLSQSEQSSIEKEFKRDRSNGASRVAAWRQLKELQHRPIDGKAISLPVVVATIKTLQAHQQESIASSSVSSKADVVVVACQLRDSPGHTAKSCNTNHRIEEQNRGIEY